MAEQQGYAPQGGKTDEGIYHTADGCGLSAADPRHDIKSEQSYAAPVYASDYSQDKRNAVNNHAAKSPFPHSLPALGKIIYENFAIRQNLSCFALYNSLRMRYPLITAYPIGFAQARSRLISLSHNPVFAGCIRSLLFLLPLLHFY